MKIGLLGTIGRTNKNRYQYDEFTTLIIKYHVSFADHVIIVSSSRYTKKELFDDL